jgi:Pregnancy-associated plasma protein-A/Secretion system C-terminal sorting domain
LLLNFQMIRKFKSVFIFAICVMVHGWVEAQQWCGLPSVTDSQKEALLNQFKTALTKKNARKGNSFTIYLRPKIIHSQQGNPIFFESQIHDIIKHVNTVFEPINLKFIIRDNKIDHIYDSNYYNLNIKDEGTLRRKNDDVDGINLYFAHSIVLPDLTLLNGYAVLPNLSKGSNFIFLSYLENSSEDFRLLKEKILIHELGHYFGLLHTFQDSNDQNITKRELVTRSVGANCSTMGDQLCDTPADPFEKAPSISALGCAEPLPPTLLDLNGDRYTPPTDNFMSYQNKCTNRFTDQQYQKMEAGLNIRLSPDAEYNISNPNPNFISIKSVNKSYYCPGEYLNINYELKGVFSESNQFKVEVSDKNGTNFKQLDNIQIIDKNNIKIKIDDFWQAGSNYRLIIKSTSPETESPISEHFEIKARPSATILTSKSSVNLGEETKITIQLGGSGPWNFIDWEGNKYTNISSSNLYFTSKPEASRLYFISNISNSCGNLSQSPGIFVNVVQPNMTILSQDNLVFCKSGQQSLAINGSINPINNKNYRIAISDNNVNYTLTPQITGNVFTFVLPQDLTLEKTYSISVSSGQLGDYTTPIKFVVKPLPNQPKIISPIQLCYGLSPQKLTAEGKNLKWYFKESDLIYTDEIIPNTKNEGKSNYFVSQTNEFNCESTKSKIEVKVMSPVIGKISGDRLIQLGDSAHLKLEFLGEAPWEFEIANLGMFQANVPETILNIRPSQSTVYELKSLTNICGKGSVLGSANIEVGYPLSLWVESSNHLQVFPNPVFKNTFSVILQQPHDLIKKIILYSLDGHLVKIWNEKETKNLVELSTGELSEGNYILEVQSTLGKKSKRLIIH